MDAGNSRRSGKSAGRTHNAQKRELAIGLNGDSFALLCMVYIHSGLLPKWNRGRPNTHTLTNSKYISPILEQSQRLQDCKNYPILSCDKNQSRRGFSVTAPFHVFNRLSIVL